jgi:hypothetical protein
LSELDLLILIRTLNRYRLAAIVTTRVTRLFSDRWQ